MTSLGVIHSFHTIILFACLLNNDTMKCDEEHLVTDVNVQTLACF